MSESGSRPLLRRTALGLALLVATATATPAIAETAGKSTTTTVARTVSAATAVPVQPGPYTGLGFDPCAAPSTAAMQAWSASPYRAIGIYIAGNAMACQQPNLTAGWVSTVTSAGWHLLPIDVGYQAPCTAFIHKMSSDPGTATSQGAAAADDAANHAGSLGIPTGSTVYNDMEAYDTTAAGCSAAVLSFLSGWTGELHVRGFLSGVYSSAASGISDLAAQYSTGTYNVPDQIWFARWNGAANTDSEPYASNTLWANHQRVHQYSGGTDETWGGVTINIDHDYLDVGGTGGGGGGPAPQYWVDTSPAAPVYATPTSTSQTGTLYAGTNYVYCKVWGRKIGSSSVYNHWWLRTDPDVGPANQYVSAYYLSRWGNDEAKDNNGTVIPDC